MCKEINKSDLNCSDSFLFFNGKNSCIPLGEKQTLKIRFLDFLVMMKDYNKALYHEIFVTEEYVMIKQSLAWAKSVFDIGGHVWYFSLWALKQNPELVIHFFEPFPQLLEQAKANLEDFSDQIVFNSFGLAKQAWDYQFFFNPEKTMQSSQTSSFLNSKGQLQTVHCENLNHYLDNHAIDQIDLLKLDIEGMEYEVLSDLSPENRKKIKNLIAEIHILLDLDLQKWNALKSQLSSYFSKVDIYPSPYSDKIFLVYAQS